MGLYIAENQCKYEVPDGKLDEAVKWLEGRRGGTYRTASYRTDTSIVTEECGEMFGGDVSFSWQRPVTDFLERFCLPGSYATFRNDDEFCWLMAELKPNGKVEWSEEAIENPFWKRCEELEEGTEGIGGNMGAGLEYEPAGDESQVAVAEIAGRTWMFYVYDEDGGGAFGAVEIDDPDASSAERVASRWFGSEGECKVWLSGVAVGAMAGARAKEEGGRMRVTAVFDMLSTEHVITVPDGLTDGEIRERVEDWLDENLAMVADEMRSSEIWVRSIEKEEE